MVFPFNLLPFFIAAAILAAVATNKFELETCKRASSPEPCGTSEQRQADSEAEEMTALLHTLQPPLSQAKLAAAQRKLVKSDLTFAQLIRLATTLPGDMAFASISEVARSIGLASLSDRLAFFEAVVRRGGVVVEGAPYAL